MKARLIILDEPTASLAAAERAIVYRTIRHLARAEGAAVLFVSHFLDEIVRLTDEVTVLRDGVVVLHAETSDLDERKIAASIVGREVAPVSHTARASLSGPALLEVDQLSSPGKLAPCSFQLRAGEVVGIAGFLGAGRSELLYAIFGAERAATGTVRLDGRPVGRSPAAAVRAGMGLVPEDRMRQGLIGDFPLWRNATLPCLEALAWHDFLMLHDQELACAQAAVERLQIKTAGLEAPVASLSGGNAQKVSIAKWLTGGPLRVLLLDEPTAGVDIGAKAEILQTLRSLAAGGTSVLLVSAEFAELLAVSDRILVLRDGALVAQRQVAETNEHELILLAGGTVAQGPPQSGCRRGLYDHHGLI